jgi:hypothetical protein
VLVRFDHIASRIINRITALCERALAVLRKGVVIVGLGIPVENMTRISGQNLTNYAAIRTSRTFATTGNGEAEKVLCQTETPQCLAVVRAERLAVTTSISN